MPNKDVYTVGYAKWSFWRNFYVIHYRDFKSREKARSFIDKLHQKKRRRFVWELFINGEEVHKI